MEAIRNSAVYMRELESGHLLELYSLVSWKGYPEEKNTWKLYLAVQPLKKFINSFYKDYPDKLTATLEAIDIISLMARPIIKSTTIAKPTKQKWG